jgi:hypothetical protein
LPRHAQGRALPAVSGEVRNLSGMKRAALVFALGLVLNHTAPAAMLPKPDLIVAADGSSDFETIQGALDKIPKTNTERMVVLVKNGIYHEKIRVDSSHVIQRGKAGRARKLNFRRTMTRSSAPDDIGRAIMNMTEATEFQIVRLPGEVLVRPASCLPGALSL